MNIKTIATLAVAAAFLIPASAMAQTYTYETEESSSSNVGTTDGPRPYFGSHSSGKSVATLADGTKVKSTFECVSMSQPPGIFQVHVVCDITASDGTFSSVYGCNALNEDGSETSCVGGTRGKTGAYEGRIGSATFLGKGGKGMGTGHWHE